MKTKVFPKRNKSFAMKKLLFLHHETVSLSQYVFLLP